MGVSGRCKKRFAPDQRAACCRCATPPVHPGLANKATGTTTILGELCREVTVEKDLTLHLLILLNVSSGLD